MKRLLLVLLILAGSMVASSAYSQVRFHANVHIPAPFFPPVSHVHIYAQPVVVPPVVCAPAPYYNGYVNEGVVVAPRYGYGYERFPERRVYVEHRGFERRNRRW